MRASSSVFAAFATATLLLFANPSVLLVNGQTTLSYCNDCPMPDPDLRPSARISDFDDEFEHRLVQIRESFARLDAGMARAHDVLHIEL